jgi:hypothetical protein
MNDSRTINVFEELGKQLDKENYFTNCLCFLLRSDRKLRTDILSKLLGIDANEVNQLKVSNIVSQERFYEDDRIADLVLTDKEGKVLIVIENKVDDSVKEDQLDDYMINHVEPAVRRGLESWLVLLTRDDERSAVEDFIDNPNFRYARWDDLYRVIANRSRNRHGSVDYAEMFLRFLERRGMHMVRPMRKTYGQMWLDFVDFHEGAQHIMDEVSKRISSLKPGFKIWESEGTDLMYKPNPFVGRWFTPKKYRKKREDDFWLWFGFLQTKKSMTLHSELTFPPEFYKRVVLQYHESEFGKWRAFLLDRNWKKGSDFKEDKWHESTVYKSKSLSRVLRNSTSIEDQALDVFDFAKECFDDLRESRLYPLYEKAILEY